MVVAINNTGKWPGTAFKINLKDRFLMKQSSKNAPCTVCHGAPSVLATLPHQTVHELRPPRYRMD